MAPPQHLQSRLISLLLPLPLRPLPRQPGGRLAPAHQTAQLPLS
jgi:hypothetical protein